MPHSDDILIEKHSRCQTLFVVQTWILQHLNLIDREGHSACAFQACLGKVHCLRNLTLQQQLLANPTLTNKWKSRQQLGPAL